MYTSSLTHCTGWAPGVLRVLVDCMRPVIEGGVSGYELIVLPHERFWVYGLAPPVALNLSVENQTAAKYRKSSKEIRHSVGIRQEDSREEPQ